MVGRLLLGTATAAVPALEGEVIAALQAWPWRAEVPREAKGGQTCHGRSGRPSKRWSELLLLLLGGMDTAGRLLAAHGMVWL